MLSPTTSLQDKGGGGEGVDSSFEHMISPVGGGFELRMQNSDSTCSFYKMVKVSNPNTHVLIGPT